MEYHSPVCRARICRKSPLIFQHPSFILARRNNRHHFRGSSRVMPMPPGYTKVFGFAPTWCTRIPRNFIAGYFCFAKTLHRPARRSIKAKQQGINVRSYFYINRSSGGGQRQRAPNIQQIFGALTSAGVGAVTKRIKPGVH